MKKAKLKETFGVVTVTSEMLQEPDQKQLREIVKNVSSAEVTPGSVVLYTRTQVGADRYRMHAGDLIILKTVNGIRRILEVLSKKEFEAKYDLIEE